MGSAVIILFLTTALLIGTSSAATTTRLPSTSSKNIYDSAIFVCGYFVYQDLHMIFPPSDLSLPNIVNATLAETVHQQSYKQFCGKLDTYILCVKTLVARKINPIDEEVETYLDLDNFDPALRAFCNENNSVSTQFMCTKDQVEKYSCPNGGIFGLIGAVENAINNRVTRETFCSELRKSVRCRIEKQLKHCDYQYSKYMESFYTNLTPKFCKTS